MMKKLKYNPNDHYQLNAPLLIVGVIIGLIFGLIYKSTTLLIMFPMLSQYRWLADLMKRVVFHDQIQALNRLTSSATLGDRRDNYTKGRYKDVVKYALEMYETDYLLYIDANGITNTRHLMDLAEEVGAAFHHPAYLQDINNGVVVYRIDLSRDKSYINESNF